MGTQGIQIQVDCVRQKGIVGGRMLNFQSDKTTCSAKWTLHEQSPKKRRSIPCSKQFEWPGQTKNSPVAAPSEQEKPKKLQSKLHQKRNKFFFIHFFVRQN